MKGLLNDAGKYRKQSVGIIKGSKLKHLAPSFANVSYLMKDLFNYLKKDTEIILIKSCVFHYEMSSFYGWKWKIGKIGQPRFKIGS
jgi:Fic family protein